MPSRGCTCGVPPSPEIAITGLAIGVLYGLFGVGSAFATPLLAIIGVPGLAAVVCPLPALLPGSAAGAWTYSKAGRIDWTMARRAVAGGVPASVVGSLCSQYIGGSPLVMVSGLVLIVVGIRILWPTRTDPGAADRAAARRENATLVVGLAIGVGFFAGLLANGGGFLLVPLFIVLFGLQMPEATGTSLVVAAALTLPTLVTHALVGDVVWSVTVAFTLGLMPGTLAGARVATHVPADRLLKPFGLFVTAFAVWFLIGQLR